MTGPEPGRRPASHREVTPGEALAQRLMRPLLAVAIVVVTIVLLILINGHDGAVPVGASTASLPTAGRPTPPSAAVPSGHRHQAHPRPAAAAPAGHGPATPRRTTAAVAPVTVLNNSLRTGLAHQVAGQLQARGWPVGYVGNLRGRIAEVTAYFAPGSAAAAHHLAAQFTSIRRVLPEQLLTGLHTPGVTLVLTRDWAG